MSTARLVGLGIVVALVAASAYFWWYWDNVRWHLNNPDEAARLDLDLSKEEDMNEYRDTREQITKIKAMLEYIKPAAPLLWGLLGVVVVTLLTISLMLISNG